MYSYTLLSLLSYKVYHYGHMNCLLVCSYKKTKKTIYLFADWVRLTGEPKYEKNSAYGLQE